ncbi:uncharacterized protein DUF1904 [Neobacillus bataviensis]|uniref:Uncharacterized protein DUF1904 n=1 Tax=Neobacillus bataviensis TaxID=220685 RepID=A0A561D029_9BACI|nr:DUF1904 family protein [Neobacillus bataviensis]TWD96567.1 uncharacterized protein DUF1904 [Neobacillus bataviensis]
MPQLIFKGISVNQVKKISTLLVKELADLCECETDNFTLEIPESTFVFNDNEVQGFPFIEVKWFERGQELQDQFAKIITKHVHSVNITEVEVAFSVFLEAAYYLNGKNFA